MKNAKLNLRRLGLGVHIQSLNNLNTGSVKRKLSYERLHETFWLDLAGNIQSLFV